MAREATELFVTACSVAFSSRLDTIARDLSRGDSAHRRRGQTRTTRIALAIHAAEGGGRRGTTISSFRPHGSVLQVTRSGGRTPPDPASIASYRARWQSGRR